MREIFTHRLRGGKVSGGFIGNFNDFAAGTGIAKGNSEIRLTRGEV
jgi:hypothetical protein